MLKISHGKAFLVHPLACLDSLCCSVPLKSLRCSHVILEGVKELLDGSSSRGFWLPRRQEPT